MKFFTKLRNRLIGRALEKCSDPFEEGRVIVMINFAIFMFVTNLPYTVISYGSFAGHFISAMIQNITMVTVIVLLNRGYRLNLARNIFFANFFLQNVYHFLINNGAGQVLEQGVLFFTLIVLFAFLLYGSRFGWSMFAFMCGLMWLGIYNYYTNNSVIHFSQEYADPMMSRKMGYLLVLPLAMNVYLVSEFVKSQSRAKKQIYEQNTLLVEKNREITDSINYAKRIQEAILPSASMVNSALPDCFVFYKPKDIVAGDFYFLEKRDDLIFLAVADCTGHGVPGAMLSVMCSNALKQSVMEFGLHHPGKILDKTRQTVIANLSGNEDELKDGMDISLAVIEQKNKRILWSGANSPLWLLRNGQLIDHKGDKQPVGNHHRYMPFATHTITIEPGDVIYLFSDGYKDQFGGDKEKKFTAKRLKDKLISIHAHPMAEQCMELEKTFTSWKGNYEQVDDVCIIGFRIH